MKLLEKQKIKKKSCCVGDAKKRIFGEKLYRNGGIIIEFLLYGTIIAFIIFLVSVYFKG
jgi:hypothetical protein